MTTFIVPFLLAAAFVIWLWQVHLAQRDLIVFPYKLRYQWQRMLVVLQPIDPDQLNEGIVNVDAAYRVVYLNGIAAQWLGQTAVSLIGQSLDALYPQLAGEWEQALGNKVEVIEDKVTPPRTYELCLKPRHNWRRKLQGYLLIIDDVTEQKNSAKMRHDMTHTMIHDLRAPLSNSMFALQMLDVYLNGETSPEATKIIEMTIVNTEKMLERVNKILDMERLEGQQMPLAFSAVSLADVVSNVLDAQAARISDKELDIIIDVPERLALVWADADLLERVLQNLVDNSIKFTPTGGEIVIGVTADPDANSPAALVTISDSGTGIPPSLQAHIFDKFAGEKEKGGSGLGLAFCKTVLAAHSQDIWMESEPGEGTTFTFSLSLLPQHNPASQPVAA
jgi:signal transduction histidine kinase